ncbi:hypothetical protein FJT64_024867 [Amphibalanus amphitrite]|uniref:Outer dense fiber protein 3-like protein 2 n=1 Tax=Amphibalanus amphitrite TaxID=1232801 RepID=A0A6A4W9D9_AMPAM|nr:hypothetical protein FJT64_024867 [Amphibalanus amphitrite]
MGAESEAEPAGRRDAMGEFIPAPGGRPLTALCAPTPGPANYQLPELNAHRPGRARAPAAGIRLAVTLKPRLSAPDYRCSPGPVHLVTVGDVASRPARTSLKAVPAAGVTVGLPSPLDKGIVSAPAPVYGPEMTFRPFESESPAQETPGPAAYSPEKPARRRAPAFSLAGQLTPSQSGAPPAPTPAPNAYSPRPVLARAARYPLGLRHVDMSGRQQQLVPSPAAYTPRGGGGCRLRAGATLKGRASRYTYTGFDQSRPLGDMSQRAQRTRPVIY